MTLGCGGKSRVARMRQAPRESERTIVLGPCLSLIFSFTFRDPCLFFEHDIVRKSVPTFRDHAVLATLICLGAAWQPGESII